MLAGLLVIALLLNSAWLWAFADASLFYYANVALHPVLGTVLALSVLRRASRRILASGFHVLTIACLSVGLATGVLVSRAVSS